MPLHLYLAVFVSGLGFTTDFSARRALMAHLVPRTALGTVAALDTTALTASFLLGPALAGIAIGVVGFAGAYVLLAAFVTCSFTLVLSVPRDAPGGLPARRLPLARALRTVAANRTVLAVLLITMVMNGCGFPLPVPAAGDRPGGVGCRPPLRTDCSAAPPASGRCSARFAVGAVPPRLAGRVFSGGSLLLLCGIFVFALSRSYLLSVTALFVGGFGFAGFAALQTAVVLRGTAPELRGRALGAVTFGIGAQPFGALALGGLARDGGRAACRGGDERPWPVPGAGPVTGAAHLGAPGRPAAVTDVWSGGPPCFGTCRSAAINDAPRPAHAAVIGGDSGTDAGPSAARGGDP